MGTSSHNCVTNHLHIIILITTKVDTESGKSRSGNKFPKVTYKYWSQYLNSVLPEHKRLYSTLLYHSASH